MPRKRYKPEEIVAKLRAGRCAGLAGSEYDGCDPSYHNAMGTEGRFERY